MTTHALSKSDKKRQPEPLGLPWQIRVLRSIFRTPGRILPGLTSRIAFNSFTTARRKPITEADQQFLGTARRVKVSHGDIELVGYVWDEYGPTILLVHGWESNASRLRPFVEPLKDSGYRVIAFDAPAHGASPGKQTNPADFGNAVRAVIEQYGPIYAIIAHSFGAASTSFMLSVQSRATAKPTVSVEKLVLFGSPSDLSVLVRRWAETLSLPERVLAGMYQIMSQRTGLPKEAFTVNMYANLREIPGMIVHDRQDRLIPFSEAEAIVREWPQADLVATEGLGHRGTLRDPDVVKRVVTFCKTDD